MRRPAAIKKSAGTIKAAWLNIKDALMPISISLLDINVIKNSSTKYSRIKPRNRAFVFLTIVFSEFSAISAIDHEVYELVDIVGLVSNYLKLLNGSVRKKVGH